MLAIHSVVSAKGSGGMPVCLGHRQPDGCQQHGRGVEAQHDRAGHGQQGEQDPEHDDPVVSPPHHGMGGDVEDAGELGDLRGHRDGQQEDRDRKDLVQDLGHRAQPSGSGSGPKTWLQVQPAQVMSSARRCSRAACTAA